MRRLLLLTLPLVLSACPRSPQSAESPPGDSPGPAQPVTAAPASTLEDTLLASARLDPATSETTVCIFLPFGDNGTGAISRYRYNEVPFYAKAVEAGYFTTDDGPPFRLKTTARYEELRSHARNSNPYAPKLCVGKARVVSLSSVRQLGPDKVSAQGVLQLDPEPWATDDMMKLFNGNKGFGTRRELGLMFRRVDGVWTAERY